MRQGRLLPHRELKPSNAARFTARHTARAVAESSRSLTTSPLFRFVTAVEERAKQDWIHVGTRCVSSPFLSRPEGQIVPYKLHSSKTFSSHVYFSLIDSARLTKRSEMNHPGGDEEEWQSTENLFCCQMFHWRACLQLGQNINTVIYHITPSCDTVTIHWCQIFLLKQTHSDSPDSLTESILPDCTWWSSTDECG